MDSPISASVIGFLRMYVHLGIICEEALFSPIQLRAIPTGVY